MITSEKMKSLKRYDFENEIVSYQATVGETFASAVSGNSVYLIIKSGANRIVQILREKTNIEKLEIFLKKEHYDIAYKFAKNENFSDEVLADISKYYGDFYYKKVMWKL